MSTLSAGDANHALVRAFDESTNSFRTSLSGAEVDINVSAFTDSIKIGDGAGTTATITSIGAKKGLDVVVNDITISHTDDSIRIGDGSNLTTVTQINTKKGLDVNVINSQTTEIAPSGATELIYGESLSLAIGAYDNTVDYTAPAGNPHYMQKVYFSGTQIGTATIYKNSAVILRIRLSPAVYTQTLDLATGSAFGVIVNPGDNIIIESQNNGTNVGDFDATLQLMET